MKILGIETSCDETAICVLEAQGNIINPEFKILGNALYSQIAIHKEFGGVFPSLAKREHALNAVPLLKQALLEAELLVEEKKEIDQILIDKIKTKLIREETLAEQLIEFISQYKKPEIDSISVTSGPGLEPALWVGINFAKTLEEIWNIPVYPINHMEGHIVSPLFETQQLNKVSFPALALLISGGHTELVLIKNWSEYEVVGQTKDDAVGEAFDKVARMLDLPYPGGPEISKLASGATESNMLSYGVKFPRPMIHSPDFNFSFSGLKTAVLYFIKKQKELTPELKACIAKDFEDAVVDVLISKTKKALEKYDAKTLILGGGVIANKKIRSAFEKLIENTPNTNLLLPSVQLSTDNAVMIAIAGYLNILLGKKPGKDFIAQGNLGL